MNAGQKAAVCGVFAACVAPIAGAAQSEVHGRRYQAPPATGHIVIMVEKAYNQKPVENAAVIFHASRNGKDNGNLEIKTNSQGKATMDLLEAGSHVTVQVIANGYATTAQEFDVTEADQEFLVKMQRPREQVSVYVDNDGKASTLKPGIQEPEHRVTSGAKPTVAIVSGTLKDEHGGRIPGGIVRLHVLGSTGADASQATDAEGNFRFDRILPGTYELQMSAPGMSTQTQRNLILGAGDNQIFRETLHPAAAGTDAPRSPLPPPASEPR